MYTLDDIKIKLDEHDMSTNGNILSVSVLSVSVLSVSVLSVSVLSVSVLSVCT